MANLKRLTSLVVALLLAVQLIPTTLAVVSVPERFSYSGTLVDEQGSPVTTPYTFRFSLWSGGDFATTDLDATGAINPAAVNFSGYEETQTITPNADGSFLAEVGSVIPLPNLNIATHRYLQVEVKAAGTLDTSYILLDPDQDITTALDRKPLDSAPFAINADTLDNVEIGTAKGQLATLGAGGTWTVSQMASGTNAETFTLNADNTAGDVSLSFGTTLGKAIKYSTTNNRFEINSAVFIGDNFAISGNAFIGGLVNGRDIAVDGATLDQAVLDIATLTATTATLQTKLTDTTAALTAADAALATQNNATVTDLAATQAKVATLTADLTTTTATLTATQTDLTNTASTLGADIAALQTAQADTATAVTATQTAIANLTTQGSTTAADLATTQASLAALTATQTNIATSLGTVTSNLAALTQAQASTATAVTTAQAAINSLSASTTASLATLNTDLATLTTNTTASLATLNTDLATAVTQLNTLSTSTTNSLATLTADLATANTKIDTLTASTTASLATLTTNLATTQADLTTLTNTVTTANTGLAADIATLNSTLATTQADITTLGNTVAANNTTTLAELTTINTKITTLNSTLATTQADITALTSKTALNSIDIADLQTAVTTLATNLNTATTDITALTTRLTTAETNITTLQAANTALDTRVATVEATAHTANTDTGTTSTIFTLNSDNTAGNIGLSFGTTLNKSITYDTTGGKFIINDGVFISDNLALTGSIFVGGLVDGRDIALDGTRLDALEAKVSKLKANTVAMLSWEFVPKINGEIKRDKIGGYTAYVMTHPGRITAISVTANPRNKRAKGTYYITKNDGGKYTANTVMTSINIVNVKTANSAYSTTPTVGVAGLTFAAGDIIRIYHSRNKQKSVRATLEVVYE